MMKSPQKKGSATNYFFILLLLSGVALLGYTLFTGKPGELFSGMRQIALGIILIGTGEWINHPLQKSLAFKDEDHTAVKKFQHRKRNPSSLGNLLEIVGLLLIFIGLADFV